MQPSVGGDFMKALYILVAVAGMHFPALAVAQVPLKTLRTCLEIEDQSKERLDCYDAKIAPSPKQVSAPAKTVQDCRFIKEEDERLNCFNRFVNPPPKKNTAAYWQFFERPADVEVKPSPRYGSEKECESAFKIAEARLKKAYPDRYPLIGSCEEFH
jgi:hypothetical protein